MRYNIEVFKDDKLFEVVQGDDVNDVHQRAANLGYYDKRKLAKATTDTIKTVMENETNLLRKAINKRIKVSWNYLLSDFYDKNPEPIKPNLPKAPRLRKITEPPKEYTAEYQPKIKLFDRLSRKRKEALISEAKKRFNQDFEKWRLNKTEFEEQNKAIELQYEKRVKELSEKYEREHKLWKQKRDNIYKLQKKYEENYKIGGAEGVEKYFEMVLRNSDYGNKFFDKKMFLKYYPDNKMLFVEYYLPDKKNITRIKEIKYVATRDEFQEVNISESELNKRYDNTLYEITLRAFYEIFLMDEYNFINQVVFNGLVDTIDTATGQAINPCIISIGVAKEKYLKLNLEAIEPKECFRGLKGISATKLHNITPIAPIMNIDKDDRRIVDGYAVVKNVNEGTNLAAMHWEDFEHLIREIFEKEFAQGGGEVKVTQASRDGGVDAIAFDPDPIRGGKIVIQAKRYTNVVGVAAVRDLYGTVMNEGAIKGILVTTSNYGTDAYDFAREKPITLLNGANLLHLLEKHGYKAMIDVKEAKKIIAEREQQTSK